MRLHGAAAFILTRGMGPAANNEFTLDVNRVPTLPAVISSRNLAPALHMVDPTLTNRVAGAFNDLNDDMMKGDDQALKELQEISASFKKLAASDFSSLFRATEQAATAATSATVPPVAVPPVAEAAAPQPAVPQPAVPQPAVPQPDAQPSKSIPSYTASLKKSAQFNTAPPPPVSSGPASYMDSLSSAGSSSKAAPVTGPGMGAQSSYLNALQPPSTKSTQKSYPTAAASSASSYLDSVARSASMSPANGPTMNYPTPPRYQPPKQETYYQPPPQETYYQPPPQQTYTPPPQTQMPPPQAQMPPPQAQVYPPQAFPPQVFPPQETYAPPPPQGQQPVYSQPPPQAQPMDRLHLEEPPTNKQQRVAPRAEVLDFAPDNEDLMSAGSAPRIENPPPRSQSMSQHRLSVAATKMSGYIPASQGLGMSGHAQNVPDPQPKPAMNISPFSKRVAGYENGMMEQQQQQQAPQPRPPMPMSPFASMVSGLDGMSEHAPQVPTPKPKPPMSVFSKKISGIDGMREEAPRVPQAKPKPPMSVFSKKISGLDGMSERAPNVPQPKPKPPMPVFSQKIPGIMSDNERMQATGGARMAPEPQERMSVAGRKVSGIPTYANNGQPGSNNNYNDGWAEPRSSQPMSVFAKKVNGIMPDNDGMANSNRGGAPRPEQPMSVFAKRINSNVPRVVANNGDTFSNGSAQYTPEPHPMEYARPSQAVAPGFALDHQDSLAAGTAPHVPNPPPTGSSGWENYPPHSRRSFQMNPDSSW